MLTKIKSLKTNRYFTNSSWLMLEKIIRLGIGFFVGIWIVRYLGPEKFGILSYVQSIMAIFGVFVTLGLNAIVLREIVKPNVDKNSVLSTSFMMSFIVSLFMILIIYFLKEFVLDDSQKWVLLLVLSFSLIFDSTSILNVYFQEKILSKYVVFSNLISLGIASSLRVYLLVEEYELIYFIMAVVIEKFVLSLLMVYFYKLREKGLNLSFDKDKAKYLLQNSWPLILSTLSYIVYTRTDQIMLQEFLGSHEVGIYAAAVRLYEIPFILTTIISSTFTPLLYKKYNEDKEEFFSLTLKILSYTTLVAYIIVAIFVLFSSDIVVLLFGEEYIESAKVLMVLGFITIVMFNSFLRSGYLVTINKQKILLYLNIFYILLNIVLNFFLIKLFGMMGVVYATLTVRVISLLCFLFFSSMRYYVTIQLKALLLFGVFRR